MTHFYQGRRAGRPWALYLGLVFALGAALRLWLPGLVAARVLGPVGQEPAVIFVFRPRDCGSSLRAIQALNGIAGAKVAGAMVVSASERESADALAGAHRIAFRYEVVGHLQGALLARFLGAGAMPAVAVIDSTGRPIWTYVGDWQESTSRELNHLINAHKN